jgi:CRISPR system Cascade subunit CasD
MSNNAYLALVLDGPMQSWGVSSRHHYRNTCMYPTRSGVSGMICAALGLDRGSPEEKTWLVRLAKMRFSTFLAQHAGNVSALLDDYHTVAGTRKEDGTSSTMVVTHRQYLMDTRFGVVIEGDDAQLCEIAEAMRKPHWGLYLGRKSCVPSCQICRGVVQSFDEALAKTGVDYSVEMMSDSTFEESADTLMDVPLNFQTREFAQRYVR